VDSLGLPLSGASDRAAGLFRTALDGYHRFGGEPFPLLREAIADSPAFVMPRVLLAYMTLIGSNPRVRALGLQAVAELEGLDADGRETGHVAAVRALAAGEIRGAGRILEDVAIDHPRDVLALQAGQNADFLTGDTRMLRDRIARARPHWDAAMPNYHAVLGMHAFGLEETGHYARAEAAGREAIALEPRNGWAQHAVAHVMEMQDRRADGLAWNLRESDGWTRDSFFKVHLWWHTALFHLGLGQVDEALAVYDGPLREEGSTLAYDLVDAAALLWRLHLAGVDVGGRWDALADVFAQQPHGAYAFDDVHAMMAFAAARRDDEAEDTLAALRTAAAGAGDNGLMSREVGLPVAEAILAFGRGDPATAVERLRAVRNGAGRFGGSHAQRDVLDLTLIAAARAAGQAALAEALQAERAAAVPDLA
jgi:tetratricopeptide (TPR) repeat protein